MLTDSFLFLHIPRTGGTSIERSLSLAVTGKWFPELDGHPGLMDAHLLPGLGREHQHWKLVDVKKAGRAVPDFRFSIVRNPWAWVVSEIEYFQSKGLLFKEMSWKEAIWKFVETPAKTWGHDFQPQLTWMLNEKLEMDVDFVGRTESLESHFDQICEHLGIQCQALTRQLPSPSKRDSFAEIYDDESRDWVARRFAVDCAVFGYEFPADGRECRDPAPMERAELHERLAQWRATHGWRMGFSLPAKPWRRGVVPTPGRVRIGLGTMILPRMESRHLRSWLEHHVSLGVEYFCILSDGEAVVEPTFGTGASRKEWGKKPSVDFELETPFEEIEKRVDETCRFVMRKYPLVRISYHACDEAWKLTTTDHTQRKYKVEKVFRHEAPEIEWMGLIDVDEYVVGNLAGVLSAADERTAGFSLPQKVFANRFQNHRPLEPRMIHEHYGVVQFNRKTFARLSRIKRFAGSHHAEAMNGYRILRTDPDLLRFHHFRGNEAPEKFHSIGQMKSFTLLEKAADTDDAHDRNIELILGLPGGACGLLGRLMADAGLVDYAGGTGVMLQDEPSILESIRKIRRALGEHNRGYPVCDEIPDPEAIRVYSLRRASKIYLVLSQPAVVAASMFQQGLDPFADDLLGRIFGGLLHAVKLVPAEKLVVVDGDKLNAPGGIERVVGSWKLNFASSFEQSPRDLFSSPNPEDVVKEGEKLLGRHQSDPSYISALEAYKLLHEWLSLRP